MCIKEKSRECKLEGIYIHRLIALSSMVHYIEALHLPATLISLRHMWQCMIIMCSLVASVVQTTSRMPSIEGEREQARCNTQMLILFDMVWIEDLVNVATFAGAAEVQCWITSYNVHLF